MEATVVYWGYVGGCQNYGHFLDPCFNTAPNKGTQKGAIIIKNIMEKKNGVSPELAVFITIWV